MTERNLGQKTERCTAIVLAAGSGHRMGTDTRKQYLEVNGRPLFTYCLETFEQCDFITDILLTVPEGDQEYCAETVKSLGLSGKVRAIAAGGRERCFSVHNSLQAINWPCDYVFIHDSARPFIDLPTMDRLHDAVREHKACLAGVPVKDTIKIADQDGFISYTPNRKDVWAVQTPQVFGFSLIRDAYTNMAEEYDALLEKGVTVTDDAMVAELFTEYKVKLVMASYRNIKVTTPEDMITVEAYLGEKH